MKKSNFSVEIQKDVVKQYKLGRKVRVICDEYSISKSTIYAWIKNSKKKKRWCGADIDLDYVYKLERKVKRLKLMKKEIKNKNIIKYIIKTFFSAFLIILIYFALFDSKANCLDTGGVWDDENSTCRLDCYTWNNEVGCIKLFDEEIECIKNGNKTYNCLKNKHLKERCKYNHLKFDKKMHKCIKS